MSNKKIVLYPNIENDPDFKTAFTVGDMLRKNGREVALCPAFIDRITLPKLPDGYKATKLIDELPATEMIIAFGGDGTILRAARFIADSKVPILGVNMGGKGFMAELEVHDIDVISTINNNNYTTETRMMIETQIVREDKIIYNDFALNDIVIKGDNKVIDMTIYADDEMITHFSGDGTIIATPTGSTAYSLSAGGPIVEPTAKNIIITPICAHVLEAKSFVLVTDRVVAIKTALRHNIPAYVSVDGGDRIDIKDGDIIRVTKSDRNTYLVRLTNSSFYHRISSKLITRMAGNN
ncbi:MAG: NAD(+)/NADH kinase [Oscillospiraceae bacterium]|jgi:NAD+ kinase|nr:NAD(+)/NADH kinase [Oscillospiraceae bacterium]